MREAGVVSPNPERCKQNRKYRAAVREPEVLKDWLDRWEDEARRSAPDEKIDPERSYCGYRSVEAVKTVLERLRAQPEINLPRLSMHSFRHKVTRVLRWAKLTHRVTEDDTALQLGYGEWDPEYLTAAAVAIDSWFSEMQKRLPDWTVLTQVGSGAAEQIR